ncbi:MAG TPA: GNAT family N-acetyltransferase [Actinomycetales bacterium]|jgi:predicted GNAT family acetyltransferase
MSHADTVMTSADVGTFLSAAGDFLRRTPVEHSVLLTRSAQALDEPADVRARQLWCWVHDPDGRVVMAAMRTPPYPLALSRADPDAVRALATHLADRHVALEGVSGPEAAVTAFADGWNRSTGGTATLRMRQGTYSADGIRPPAGVPGRRRLAHAGDAPLLQAWAEAFAGETGSPATGSDLVRDRIGRGLLHVWQCDGRLVSMTAVTVARAGVSRVQLVYTPAAERGRGFAGALVAAVSQQVLAQGTVPMLHTDAENSTSNAIYQRIGYTALGANLMLDLSPGPSGWTPIA